MPRTRIDVILPLGESSGGERRLLAALAVIVTLISLAGAGCQDGPLYGLKTVNPYYAMNEWKQDEAIGVTDHQRRKQLDRLADTIATLPPERQLYWSEHLKQIIENDASAEMRRIAVRAAGNLDNSGSLALIQQGLEDENTKVRMEACESLGRRDEQEAARLLAGTVGSETSQDVRHAAMSALASHDNAIAIDSLRVTLSDRNPATRSLAMTSLRKVTGKNYGEDPELWIAALDGKPVEEAETRLADRVRELF